jgi:O-antigen/teichoic acid export membrane protein
MTHVLPKSEYGLLSLVITVGELIDTSLTTWVRLALLRLGGGGMISTSLASIIFKTMATTTTGGCIIGLAISYVLVGSGFIEFWFAIASYTIGVSVLRFGLSLLQTNNKGTSYSVIEITRAISSFSLSLSAAHFFGPHFIYPSLAVSMTTFAFALIAIRLGLKGLQSGDRIYSVREITSFAGPLLILSVLTIISNAMDRLFLQYYWSAAAVGGYAATYALARQPVDVLANAINTGGYPALVARYEEGGRDEAEVFLRNQFGFFLKFVLPVIFVLFLLKDDVISALLPKDYHNQASGIFGIILLAGVGFNLRSSIFDNVFLVERKNYLQLRYFVPVFLVAVALSIFFIPAYGVWGSSVVFLTWTTLALVMSAITGRKLIRVSASYPDILRTGVLIGTCCIAAYSAQYVALGLSPFMRLLIEGLAAAGGYGMTITMLYPVEAKNALFNIRQR